MVDTMVERKAVKKVVVTAGLKVVDLVAWKVASMVEYSAAG